MFFRYWFVFVNFFYIWVIMLNYFKRNRFYFIKLLLMIIICIGRIEIELLMLDMKLVLLNWGLERGILYCSFCISGFVFL